VSASLDGEVDNGWVLLQYKRRLVKPLHQQRTTHHRFTHGTLSKITE